MSNCRWYEIDGFASRYDAENFETYIDRQVADGAAEELSGQAGAARRFRCTDSGEVWALSKPDGRSRGNWKPLPV